MSYRRITAYDPLTWELLGELPDAIKLHTVRNLYGYPTGQIIYPPSGTNRSLLNNPVAIKVERVLGDGTGEEGWNSRYLLKGTPDNDEVDTANKSCDLIGVRWWLSTVPILTPSSSQEPDGTPVKPMRRWVNKNPGQILGDIFNEVQALGFLPGMTKDFGFVNDSAGIPWDAIDDNIPYLEWPIEAPFESLVTELEVRMGLIETVFNGMEWRVFRARTHMYRDLTVGDAPIGFYWGIQNGITEQTEALDYLGTTTEALVVGADGKTFDPHNFGSDGNAYYGKTMRGLNVPWAHNADMAKAGADSMFRSGARERKEITVAIDWDASLLEPDRDVRLGDRVFVQKGDNPTDSEGAANVGEQRITVIEETDGEKRTGSVTFADKIARLEVLTAQRALRLSAGADVSSAGSSRAPGVDPREPEAPTNLVVTMANDPDENGRQRGNILVEWDHTGDALPDPVTGQVDPIDLKRFELEIESDETDDDFQFIRGVPGDKRRVWLKGALGGLAADTTYRVRVRAVPYTGITPSAWLTSGTLTVPADLDALPGADQIVDKGHRNAGVRTKRAGDAGAGFSFVADTSEQVAQFTTTTPVLDYGVGSKLKSYRRQCQVGDILVVDAEAKRVSGTAANLRVTFRFFDPDGVAIPGADVDAISSALAATSWTAVPAGTATVPSGAKTYTTRVKANVLTGLGVQLRVRNVSVDRRTVNSRLHDDANTSRTTHATDNLTSKHVSTGALFEGAAGTTSTWRGGTAGVFWYNAGGVAAFSASAAGVFVLGTLTTGSGAIFGGAGLADIQFPSGSGWTIGEAGGYLEYKAGGAGHKFTGNMIVSGGVLMSSTLQVSGATTLLASVQVGGSGQTVGFFGTGPISKPATATVTMTNQATIITAVNSLSTVLGNLGLITDNIS